MRKIRFIILALLILCLALIFASCDLAGGTVTPDGTSAESVRETTGNDAETTAGGTTAAQTTAGETTEPLTESDGAEIVKAPDFVIEGTTLSAAVSNATETFSFINRVTVSPKATWQISTDLQGKEVIPTKTVPLNVGDNVFYILVTSGDGEGLSLYTATIRRKPMYTVTYDLDGGTGAYTPQQVEEGTVITPEDPTRACYEFAGWDVDLTAPVTENKTVTAKWTLVGHTWMDEFTVDVPAGCTPGSKSYHCSVCNEIDPASVVEIPAKHTWDEGYVAVPATCTHTGLKSFICIECGKKRTETIETTEHRWNTEYTVDVPAGHTTPGSKSVHCLDCDAQKPDSSVAIPAEGHTPGANYVIVLKPTCVTEGEESLYCVKCGEMIATRPIPVDPDAHFLDEGGVVVEPTLLDPVGSRTGTCLYCDQPINVVLNWELDPYSSVDKTGKYAEGNDFYMRKSAGDIRGEKSFAPTAEDPDGNDLWFEYSLLYNSTLYNHDYPNSLSEIRLFGFRDSSIRSNYRSFYYLYLRDNNDGFRTSLDCPYRGHIDYSTYDVTASPGENCAHDLSALGNTLNGRLIGRYKAGWSAKRTDSPYLWDSEWQTLNGWHRLGFRYHQEAAINEGTVVYSGYTELYIDGVLCWRVDSNFKPGHKDSLVTKNLLLWTAEIDPEDNTKLVYTNHDSIMVGMRVDNVGRSSNEVLIAVDDVKWTCGDGFAVPVVRVENPKPVPTTLKEGVEDVIAMYFAKPDCVHEEGDEWIVVKEAKSLLEDGIRAKFCVKCGEKMEEEPLAFVPSVYDSTNAGYDWKIRKNLTDTLDGAHFYPTEENPNGLAYYFEVDFLWNETIATNWIDGDGFRIELVNADSTRDNLYLLVPKNNVWGSSDAKASGGFDYGWIANHKIVYGPLGCDGTGTNAENFPNIGEYGWHRIGVKVYQEAAIKGDGVTYSMVSTLYIDGIKAWQITFDEENGKSFSKWLDRGLMLFTATNEEGVLAYADPSADLCLDFSAYHTGEMTGVYLVYGAPVSRAVDPDFTPNDAVPVADPEAATLTVAEGVELPAKIYFQPKAD